MLDMNENKSKPDNSPQGKFLLWFSDLRTSLRVAWVKHVPGQGRGQGLAPGQGRGRGYNVPRVDGLDDYHIDGGGDGGGKRDSGSEDDNVLSSSLSDSNGFNGSGSSSKRRPQVDHHDDGIKQQQHQQHTLQNVNAKVNVRLFQGSLPNRDEDDCAGGAGGAGAGASSIGGGKRNDGGTVGGSAGGIHSPSPKGMCWIPFNALSYLLIP